MQSNAVRLFTPREANAMLPALRPLLMELADRHAERGQLEELLIEVEQDAKSREAMRDRIDGDVRVWVLCQAPTGSSRGGKEAARKCCGLRA